MGDKRTLKPELAPESMEKLSPAPAALREHSSRIQSQWSYDQKPAALSMSAVLESKIFTVVVGADRRELAVHESALSESPVLRRLCKGGFLEATSGRIELKDDDPEIFDKVLCYLYRGDYEPFMRRSSVQNLKAFPYRGSAASARLDDKYAMDSAMVYIMADKYQLDELKRIAVDRIRWLQPISHDVFFSISSWIYAAVPESDRMFRDFFTEYAPGQLMDAPQTELAPYVREGGAMIEDMVYALRSHVITRGRHDYPSMSNGNWRRLYTTSDMARTVYERLKQMRWFHRDTSLYPGATAVSVASDLNQSLEDVRTAVKELSDTGLLVSLGAREGSTEPGDELWDIRYAS